MTTTRDQSERGVPRNGAIEMLATHRLKHLSENAARRLLTEFWSCSDRDQLLSLLEEGETPMPSESVVGEMLADDEPANALADELAPILKSELQWELRRATNKYIEEELAKFSVSVEVHGQAIPSGRCPCCDLLSIDEGEEGLWDICPVCFWENGGPGPNHISLEEARQNFRDFGASKRSSLPHVESDGARKYGR